MPCGHSFCNKAACLPGWLRLRIHEGFRQRGTAFFQYVLHTWPGQVTGTVSDDIMEEQATLQGDIDWQDPLVPLKRFQSWATHRLNRQHQTSARRRPQKHRITDNAIYGELVKTYALNQSIACPRCNVTASFGTECEDLLLLYHCLITRFQLKQPIVPEEKWTRYDNCNTLNVSVVDGDTLMKSHRFNAIM